MTLHASSTWQRIGAWSGGTVAALALSPHFPHDGLLLAATAAGLYRSTDGGQHWASQPQAFSDPRVTAVAFALPGELAAPVPAVAFAATADSRFFRSADGGESWQELTAWAGLGLINAIAVSPNFAVDQTLFVATSEGVFRTQDGGSTWESSTFGLLDLEILCLACAPNFGESELLWAGSALGGLYRSRNGARSWRDAGQGLPDMAIQCIALSPNFAQDQTLYVGTESDGIYASTDGGVQWAPLSQALAGQSINCLAISAEGQTLYAGAREGVYCSTDGGRQWALTPGGAFLALALAITPAGAAVAGSYQEGIFQLATPDRPWQAAAGLTAHVPPVVLADATNSFYLLDVEGALAQSQDEGNTWQLLNAALAQEAGLAALLATGAQGALLYVATAEMLYVKGATAGGDGPPWRSYPLPTDATEPTLLACSPPLAEPPVLFLADAAGKLYRAIDGDLQWQLLAVPWVNSQLLQLYCAPAYDTEQTLYALTVQPDRDRTYLAQLWQTSNRRAEWVSLVDFYADTPAAVMTLPLDPVEQPILVGVGNRLIKLYRQADLSWAVQQHFLAPALRITSIVTTDNYLEEGTIYVTTNQGVLQSRDAGATWTSVGEGLAGRTFVAFLPAQDERPAYAVELGGALWRLNP